MEKMNMHSVRMDHNRNPPIRIRIKECSRYNKSKAKCESSKLSRALARTYSDSYPHGQIDDQRQQNKTDSQKHREMDQNAPDLVASGAAGGGLGGRGRGWNFHKMIGVKVIVLQTRGLAGRDCADVAPTARTCQSNESRCSPPKNPIPSPKRISVFEQHRRCDLFVDFPPCATQAS